MKKVKRGLKRIAAFALAVILAGTTNVQRSCSFICAF